jgi:hypothetical protein
LCDHAYAQALIIGHDEPRDVLAALRAASESDEDLLRAILSAGEGPEPWDRLKCACECSFHSKLVEVARMCVVGPPTKLEHLVDHVLHVLALPEEWEAKRVSLAVLAACGGELPAMLITVRSASILRERLLRAAKDTHSFNVRRFAIELLAQWRTADPGVLDALASGCRDLGTVQDATLQAIGMLRSIQAESVPQVVAMLSSDSASTARAAALVMREIGKSHCHVSSNSALRRF